MQNVNCLELEKSPTGVNGFDEITSGGLPRGRPTLIAGSAGSGKTLFAIGFVLNGIRHFEEPGVFVSFEESPADLAVNVATLGHNLPELQSDNRLRVLHLRVEPLERGRS